MKLLIYIEDYNMSQLSFKLQMTYSHMMLLSKEMLEQGYLTKTKEGRTNFFKLTEKGQQMRAAAVIISNDIGDCKLVNNHMIQQ